MVEDNINIHIRKVQSGNLNSFRFIIENYKKMAMSIAIRILKNYEDAKDIVQDSFVLAYQNINKFNFSTKFSTWFYKIVLNKALSEVRKNKPEFISYHDEPEIENIPDEKFDNFNQEHLQKIIETCIERLNDSEAIILRLFYYEEMKVDEIAAILEVSYSNAKVLLHRARLKLKKLILKDFQQEVEDWI